MLHQITVDDLHEMVDALTTALDAKNSYMCGHSERVAMLSLLLANTMGLSPAEQTRIHIGAHLHDIGKIGIPDVILNKQGKLTDDEFNIIRQHPAIGDNIVGKLKLFHSVADIVRHHHERFDGQGYPDGLRGHDISLGARIVAVADAFDAMTSARAYRTAFTLSQAIAETQRCQGTQFDPEIVAILVDLSTKNKLFSSGGGEIRSLVASA